MMDARPQMLKRYFTISRLLLKHGGSEWLSADARMELVEPGQEQDETDASSELADDLEAMGPTFVKLGQLLATRPDLVPAQHMAGLRRLCDDVKPFDGQAAKQIVREQLGARVSKLFERFDEEPFAAASLSQVHRARLRDGRDVAVKVQRPGIRETIVDDLDALQELAGFLERHSRAARCLDVTRVVDEFRRTLLRELDFRNEMSNLRRFSRMLKDYPAIVIPQPVDDYCSSRVLTMDYIAGTDITALNPVVRTELNGEELAQQFFDAYLHQVLVEGLFHADPHPGNILLTPDRRLALLDLGMVGRFRAAHRDELLRLLLAVAETDGSAAAKIAAGMGSPSEDYAQEEFERRIDLLVSRQGDLTLQEMNVGALVVDICRIATECGLRLPSTMALLGKTLLQLDEVGTTLDPGFDPQAAIRERAAGIIEQRMSSESMPGKIYSTLIETREFAEKLPGQLATILERLAGNDMRVRVDAIDQTALMNSLTKIANRITAGIVLAALIIGAALLMRVETQFTLFGYPGLAITLFLAAASGGAWLALGILLKDNRE